MWRQVNVGRDIQLNFLHPPSPSLSTLVHPSTMQVAEVLSDLTSLRVCVSFVFLFFSIWVGASRLEQLLTPFQEHTDALTLVTVNEKIPLQHPTTTTTAATGKPTITNPPSTTHDQARDSDRDLQRAKELVDLHRELKTRHIDGVVDEGLVRARADVGRVWGELRMRG